jgi:hypothetical protein
MLSDGLRSGSAWRGTAQSIKATWRSVFWL